MAQQTILYDEHVRLGGKIVDFHGWLLPVQYEGILAEHAHCRQAVSLFDTSHMGQFLVTGPDAAQELSKVLTQDAVNQPVGRCQYGFLLNASGGILDDTILIRLSGDEFLLVVNAGPMETDFRWVSLQLAGRVEPRNLMGQWSKLDVQGPGSFDVLRPMVDEVDLRQLRYFHAARARCAGRACILSRTGYTGELGYEVFADNAAIMEIFGRLIRNPAVKPAGLGARDLLRLEMCYPLYGQDISDETSPVEADLANFIKPGHDFLGVGAVRGQLRDGVARKLVAFRGDGRRRTSTGQDILQGDEVVGKVTSGAFSPSLGCSIGMGYVKSSLAASGMALTVRTDRADLPIVTADKPLYTKGTCRARELT